MENPTIASHAAGETSYLLPPTPPSFVVPPEGGKREKATCFRGRNPTRTDRIRARIEDDRSLLALALATFQAELTAKAA